MYLVSGEVTLFLDLLVYDSQTTDVLLSHSCGRIEAMIFLQ